MFFENLCCTVQTGAYDIYCNSTVDEIAQLRKGGKVVPKVSHESAEHWLMEMLLDIRQRDQEWIVFIPVRYLLLK